MNQNDAARPELGDPVAMTQAMVRAPSVNPILDPTGTGEQKVANLVAGWLSEWGYNPELVEVAPGRWNVIATRAGSDPAAPRLLLNGHLDTVGVEGMNDPFSGAIESDRLLGRGSADMKSGNACVLAVAHALKDADLRGSLTVALTADEEHASVGMAHLVERGGLEADFAVVCEPTSLAVMPAHKGFQWFDITVQGRAAHGSRPEVGIDAIAAMGTVLCSLDQEAARLAGGHHHPLLGPGSIHAGVIKGGTAPSVYPESCHLSVERRTLPGEPPNAFVHEIEELLARAREERPNLQVSVEPGLYRSATEVASDHPMVEALAAACKRAGAAGSIEGMTAWVDASFLNDAGIPAICFGPGSIAQAHTLDEWVSVQEIRQAAEILIDFAQGVLT